MKQSDHLKVICFCCEGDTSIIFNKGGYDYYQCGQCKTVFTPNGIDQSNMVGGGYEVERNLLQNEERIDRFRSLMGKYGKVLDFGCGHGLLVKFCNENGLTAEGYDKFNKKYSEIPVGKYNLVSMVEVIEHTFHPFHELNNIRYVMAANGILYVETSFTDVAEEEKIPLEDFFYIEPNVGHCTIFSHNGIDLLMRKYGFKPLEHINRNTRIFQKVC